MEETQSGLTVDIQAGRDSSLPLGIDDPAGVRASVLCHGPVDVQGAILMGLKAPTFQRLHLLLPQPVGTETQTTVGHGQRPLQELSQPYATFLQGSHCSPNGS